jgi:hypothetical protein
MLQAAPLRLVPSVNLEERFDENIFFREENQEHDFVTIPNEFSGLCLANALKAMYAKG